MSIGVPFTPVFGATVALSATTTSSSATVQSGWQTWAITNAGTATVFVRWGVTTATATTADFPLLPGAGLAISPGLAADKVAVITAVGTATVYVTPGNGE